jgi:Family of unknown function (DUF5706)
MSEFTVDSTVLPDNSHKIDDVDKEYFSHVKKVNDIFYDQVKISDQKAAYIFTFLIAFFVSSGEGRDVFAASRYLYGTFFMKVSSGMLAAASMSAMLCAIMVVLPRNMGRSTTLFWGAWPHHRSILLNAVKASDANYLFNQYLENADILSLIARRKYRFVSLSFKSLVVTLISYVLVLMAK